MYGLKLKIIQHKPKPILYSFKDYSHILCQRGSRSAGEESIICEICHDLIYYNRSSKKWNHLNMVSKPVISGNYW